jgi:hypothetical protein
LIPAYFEKLRQELTLNEQVVSFRIMKELCGCNDGYIRVKCVLEGGDILEFAEYVQIGAKEQIIQDTYSYHWQKKTGQILKRWDNVPHHKGLSSFPDHLHDGDVIRKSKPMQLRNVLKEITRAACEGHGSPVTG